MESNNPDEICARMVGTWPMYPESGYPGIQCTLGSLTLEIHPSFCSDIPELELLGSSLKPLSWLVSSFVVLTKRKVPLFSEEYPHQSLQKI